MNFNEIKASDREHVMQTYGRADVAFASGHGATLTSVDGRDYIDFASGIGVASLGYGDPEWASAVAEQAARLPHTSNLYYNESSTLAGELLAEAAGGDCKVFFGNSGAEANEGMIKLARKRSFDKYGPGRADILTLKNSFHGRTVTTLAATGQDVFHNYFFPFTEGFLHAAPDMDSIRAATKGSICAVMLECIQGEGGVLPLDPAFVAELVSYARERDWLVLVDEVQTGVGRTGELFSFMQYGFRPDAFSLAKGLAGGLPIGAVVAYGKNADVLTAGMHASTFGANPISCAGARVVLKRVANMEFLANVRVKGDYIRAKLLSCGVPVKEIRGLGLMIGVDFEGVDSKKANKLLLENGLVTLTAKNSLRFLPPLVITKDEIDKGVEIIAKTLK